MEQEFVSDIEYRLTQAQRELAETRQQQAVTANLLKIISRSTFDLSAVLNMLVESAARFCEADIAAISRVVGADLDQSASYGYTSELQTFLERHPVVLGRGTATGHAALEGITVHIPDVLADPEYSAGEAQKAGNYRAVVAVPLKRDGAPIGVLVVARAAPGPFTPKQIALVEAFADQAVIAIENVRLFDELLARARELAEARQQQAVTSKVLKIISRSTFDLSAVLNMLVESAARFCEADIAAISRVGADLDQSASYGYTSELQTFLERHPVARGRGTAAGHAALEGIIVHIPDVLADPEYSAREAQEAGKYRAVVAVPLKWQGAPIGVLVVARAAPGPFTPKQIALVESFADQAVIAIECTTAR